MSCGVIAAVARAFTACSREREAIDHALTLERGPRRRAAVVLLLAVPALLCGAGGVVLAVRGAAWLALALFASAVAAVALLTVEYRRGYYGRAAQQQPYELNREIELAELRPEDFHTDPERHRSK
jgi:hypothetical protein